MPRTIRQHFVPQAYLNQFAFTHEGQKVQKVYALIKQRQKIVPLPVQSVASRTTFYDFGENDQEQVVEKYLAHNVEGNFATLLRELTTSAGGRPRTVPTQVIGMSPAPC